MLVSRLHGLEDIRLEEVPEPVAGEDEVRVQVAYNGVCGSDLHMYFRDKHANPTPFILGHEIAGVVDQIGPGVQDIAEGTRVAVRPLLQCGTCERCHRGLSHLCTPPRLLGCGGLEGGGLANYCVAKAHMVYPLPDSVSLELGALVEPMAVSYHGVMRGDVDAGMKVVVFGAGPIGIGVLLALRAIGVEDVFVVEPSPQRRDAAISLGATEAIDPRSVDVVEVVRSRGKSAADVVFECAGTQASFTQAVSSLQARGRLVMLAMYEDPIEWDPGALMFNEVQVRGSMCYADGVYESVIDLMASGHYPTSGWVEHIPWGGLVEEGFIPLRRGERLKVLVDVGSPPR